MNILFVNYGDLTTNSLNHIGAFANALIKKGHACIVAIPQNPDSIQVITQPLFKAALFSELINKPNIFPDNRPADIIHAWTPRELVRSFVISYQRVAHAKLIIHLEDNEDFLLATWLNTPLAKIKEVPNSLLHEKNILALSHPRKGRAFVQAANAITFITASLVEFIPQGIASFELSPGIDFTHETARKADPKLRAILGIKAEEKIIVLTGSNTFANTSEMRDLYLAVGLLNDSRVPTKLIRTGFTLERFKEELPSSIAEHIIELGFIDKTKLPELLALADVLIQPGKAGPFNDYRLPSKLPEFFSSGRPVILPKSNIGLAVKDGVDALILHNGSPEEIASLCLKIFADPGLSYTLSANAVQFAKSHFDLKIITDKLTAFYGSTLAQASDHSKTTNLGSSDNETTLATKALAEAVSNTPLKTQTEELVALVTDLVSDLEYTTADLERLNKDASLSKDHVKNLEIHLSNFKKHTEALEEQTNLHKTRILNLEHHIEITNKELHEALVQLSESNHVLTEFKAFTEIRKKELADQVAVIENEIGIKKRKIAAMQNTFSWKITSPLRFIENRLSSSRK